jgi:tetratricopeptide (TPR) repeat protein
LVAPAAFCRGQQGASAEGRSGEIERHYAAADQAVQANDFARAQAEYRQVLSLDPAQARALTGLGVLQYGAGQPALAADTLNKALQLNVLDKRATIFLGLSEADLGRCSKAVTDLQPQFPTMTGGKLQRLVGFALLNCLSAPADADQSLAVLGKLKQLYPDDPDVLYKAAELYTRLWSQAADALITKHPESYRVHQLAGELYEAQGKPELAIREYRTALQENARLPQLHYRIAQLMLQDGGDQADDKAIAELQAELLVDSQSFIALYSLAEIERHQHKLEAAEQHYQQALSIKAEFAEARVGVAQILFDRKAIPSALTELNRALASDPDNAQAHYLLMLCYREQGDLARASTEQASFRRLQQKKSQSFQNRIDALLGSTSGGTRTETSAPTVQ